MDVQGSIRYRAQVWNLAEDEIFHCTWRGGRNRLHELSAICLHVAGDLESRGYTCIHQLQPLWRCVVALRHDLYGSDTVC